MSSKPIDDLLEIRIIGICKLCGETIGNVSHDRTTMPVSLGKAAGEHFGDKHPSAAMWLAVRNVIGRLRSNQA